MSITYEDYAITLEDLWIFDESRWLYYESLEELYSKSKPNPRYKGPFEFPGTQGQSKSAIWRTVRALNCTASSCKKICRMTSDNSIMQFLRKHLWGLDSFTSKACSYGNSHEEKARQAYIQKKRAVDDTVQVLTTGLHVHTEYLGLACSLDGQVISDRSPPRNLEIKCPYTLREKDPNNFENVLNKKQMSNFCLTRNSNGQLELKQTHEYYYQIQMGMGLTECSSCDFFVWSKYGSILITVPFNESLWKEIRKKLALFHWEIMVPEYFAMKTPRNLTAIKI
ncbi:uncharacterized protein LOC117640743 [Thrips palmi]|uniref:Uncharacterized protein LOC117640743 n=1 Tax=Thrips palmi TaxID=161013 RepID=A0A6P8YBA6_THRPL|nr:uncharacterized protein LOC117640743 [Thrips palmi]